VKLTKVQRAALVLMARRGGACPRCDEATAALTFITADRLVQAQLATFHQRAGVMSYRITEKGKAALASDAGKIERHPT
jgi:hypothetical protein